MERKHCAPMFKIIDTIDYIKKERKRLEGIVGTKEYQENIKRWGWMSNWLKKTDEEHYAKNTTVSRWEEDETAHDDDYIDDEYHCSICFKTDRQLLHTEFSFCNEYGCGMNICKECASTIGELAKQMK